ncbi:porin [Alteromonas gracilis]|uniref:porin n=1 Tax=Alteromonas gracilis TaxID=1479524 RepID=UPI0037364DF9
MIKKPLSIIAVLIGVLTTSNALSEEESLTFSGFGALATASSDSSNYEFRHDRSQAESAKKDGFAFKPLSALGVQLNFNFSSDLDFVGQFVYRDQDRQTIDTITQMAFLRYEITPSWHVRAGRLAADIFHFSDTRDVAIAYPWVKVPTEVYGIVPARSFDGADISFLKPYRNFNVQLKAFWGEGESDFTSNDYSPIKFNNIRSLGIEFVAFDWSIALKHTLTEAKNDNADSALIVGAVAQLQPLWSGATAFADSLSFSGASIHYTSLYANRHFGKWELSGEFSHIDSSSIALRHSYNGFVNLSYLFGAHTFYGLYSFADTDSYFLMQEQPDFPLSANTAQLATLVEEAANSLAHRQHTFSVGWRWDLQENLALKAQIERTDIEARGSGLRARDGLVVNGEEGVVHTLLLALNFSF